MTIIMIKALFGWGRGFERMNLKRFEWTNFKRFEWIVCGLKFELMNKW